MFAILDRKRTIIFVLAVFALFAVACGGSGGGQDGSGSVDAHPVQPTLRPVPTAVPAPQATAATATAVPPAAPMTTPAPSATPTPPVATLQATAAATEGDLFLEMVAPLESEIFTSEPLIDIVGRTRVDAVVTINDTVVEPGPDGQFSMGLDLEEGPNIIEVVASVASGEQEDVVLVVVYVS